MASLDHAVKQIYGSTLTHSHNQTQIHHQFALYTSLQQPNRPFFLRILQLPAFLYISQATLEHKVEQYGSLLAKLHFTPLDRNFQSHSYLVQSERNIISLTSLLQIKKECHQSLDVEFFLKCVQFFSRAFKTIQKKELPLFSVSQVGICQKTDFKLSDPSLYFTGHPQSLKDYNFGHWIGQVIHEILQLPQQKDMQEEILKQKFGDHLYIIRPLVQYLKTGEADLQNTLNQLSNTKSRFSEETTTVTGSYADVQELVERNQREKINTRRLSFKKMGKLAKIMVLLVIIGVIAGTGYLCFKFFNRNILCQEGEYLKDNKQCLSCFTGCIRCFDQQPTSCQRCDLNMYLILEDEEDTHGFCLNECRGKLINVGVCVRQKTFYQNQQTKALTNPTHQWEERQ